MPNNSPKVNKPTKLHASARDLYPTQLEYNKP